MSTSKLAPLPEAEGTAEPSKQNTSAWKYAYWAGRIFRYAFAIASALVPLSFVGLFVIGGGLIRPEVLEGSRILAIMQEICAPALQFSEKVLAFRTVSHGWNYLLLGIAVVTFFLRQFLLIPVEMLESHLKGKFVYQTVIEAPKIDIKEAGVASAANSSRLAMLREYTEARKVLFSEKRRLAFLSIDVVGSTKMKIGEDKLAIEHAFAEYKKFVERILKKNNIWKVAWTPDGIMCAFHETSECISAAQDVLRGLPWFNDGVHHLKTGFNVRCGANMGDVVFPESKAMEEISDEVIDVAGHMQKYGTPGTLWVPKDMIGPEANFEGFHPIEGQRVDGRDVMEWRPAATETLDGKASSAPAS